MVLKIILATLIFSTAFSAFAQTVTIRKPAVTEKKLTDTSCVVTCEFAGMTGDTGTISHEELLKHDTVFAVGGCAKATIASFNLSMIIDGNGLLKLHSDSNKISDRMKMTLKTEPVRRVFIDNIVILQNGELSPIDYELTFKVLARKK
jgi:hypothetical protein